MAETLKKYCLRFLIVILLIASFSFGCQIEKMKADKTIAEMEKEYVEQKNKALEQAESMRKAQEDKYLAEIADLKRANADRVADVLRVRQQFEKRLSGSGNTDVKQCNQRAARCEQLLSEAYELAAEGESLLGDRDARLKVLQ